MGWLDALTKPRRVPRKAGDKIQRGVLFVAIALVVAMVVVAILLALATHDGGAGVTSFVLFAAASAVGAALGFLFGMPRSRLGDLTGDGSGQASAPDTKASTYYLTNSNLIKVSDWLTTIVIGLGLVNLGKVGPAIRQLGHALERPLGAAAYSGAVGVCVLIVGVLAGFLLNYLWTSIRVRELLEESERQNQQHVPELRNRTVAQARAQADAKDLKLVVPPGTPDDAQVVEQTLPPGVAVPRGTGLTVTMLAPTPAAPPDPPAPTPAPDPPTPTPTPDPPTPDPPTPDPPGTAQ